MLPSTGHRSLLAVLSAVVTFSTIVFAIGLARLCGFGDFFNSYPFITDDGFDWIYEGHALAAWIKGEPLPSFPILRSPGFIFATSVDALLKTDGAVVIFLFATCYGVGGFLVINIARLYNSPKPITVAIVVYYILTPLNYFRLFILADALALTLMLGAVCFILRYIHFNQVTDLAVGSTLSLAAAMTQTYGAIPLLVGLPVICLARPSRREFTRCIVSSSAVVILFLLLQAGWKALIPHERTPDQFGLLAISMGMAQFYGNVWTYFFSPLAPLLILAICTRLKGARSVSPDSTILCSVIGAFAVLTFFYQWPEARFTFIYFPVLLLLILSLSVQRPPECNYHWATISASAVSCILVLLQIVFTPDDYWRPRLTSLDWQPERSWIALATQARPVDRLNLGVSAPAFPSLKASVPVDWGPYRTDISASYIALRNRPLLQNPEISDPLPMEWKDHTWITLTGMPGGFLESFTADGHTLSANGWAARSDVGPAIALYVYEGETLRATATCDVLRLDVNQAIGLPRSSRAGFSFSIPFSDVSQQVSVVALYSDGTSYKLPTITRE